MSKLIAGQNDESRGTFIPAPPPSRRGARAAFFSLLIAGTVAAWFLREPLRNLVFAKGVMLNDAPTEEAIEQVIDAAPDRQAAIRTAWNTGKIVHREAAIRQLSRLVPIGKPIPAESESWVLAAAMDPDMDVREAALAMLRDHKHPALAAICMAQIQDPDPQARLLGLNNLKRVTADIGVPLVMPLLSDPDPLIVATGLKLLENWTGEKFGVKLSETLPIENEKTGLKEYREESRAKAKASAERAKTWWAEHQAEYAPVHLELPAGLFASLAPVPAGDFTLSTLEGRPVRLSEFRGKVVLINFWTTWCTACVSEMPELVELRKRYAGRLVILGVSLDYVPDEHGHFGGHETAEAHEDNNDSHAEDRPSLNDVRKKVARTAKAREINYTILLDEKNDAGGRFNGGELPTTVIVDAEGNVRRRFIGARSLPVFEAMIAEAGQPPPWTRKKP